MNTNFKYMSSVVNFSEDAFSTDIWDLIESEHQKMLEEERLAKSKEKPLAEKEKPKKKI